jgi:BirA family biotin operon repressor/biotin-[acetyl-CoA-carboxylase] ligase
VFAKVKPNTQIIGQNIIYFNQVDSTNQFATELIKQNLAENGTVIVAEYQTMGRGQGGKSWISEPFENLLFSIILKHVTNSPSDPFIVNKMATLAIHNFVSDLLPHEQVKIKWPNDILINNRKVCGILVENNFTGHKLNYSIIGIGLNVNQKYEHFKHIHATSLGHFLQNTLNRETLLNQILESFENTYDLYLDGLSDAINHQFDKSLLGYETNCLFETENGISPGIIKGCDNDGRLIIEMDGREKSFIHGSIKQLIS